MTIKLKHAIKELKQILNIDLSLIKDVEFIEKAEKGYDITKKDSKTIIKYHSINDALSAIGILISNSKSNYQYQSITSFKRVGLMLDVARMAVPKIETLKKYVLLLSLFGYQYMGLYLEDVFEVDNEPLFGYMRGRYTQEELKTLDDYAYDLDFEIIPYIQTLAHLASIFKHYSYASIKDTHDILLVNEERTYELIENMLKTTKKVFRSEEINIGMDEAYMLGLGQYLAKNGFQDRPQIMLKHLEKVNALCMKYNYKPSMWADMFFRLAGGGYLADNYHFTEELKSKIPNNIKLIYWDYYQTDINKYHKMFNAIKELTSNYGYAGGAWKWIGFAPSNDVTIATMSLAIKAAREHQVEDFVVTSWADDGAEASQFSILSGLLFIITEIHGDDRLNKDNLLLLLSNLNYQNWLDLDLPNRLYQNLPTVPVNPSKYLFYEDPFLGLANVSLHPSYESYYQKYTKVLRKYAKQEGPYQYIFDTLYRLCDVLSLKSTLSIRLKDSYDRKDMDTLRKIAKNEIPTILRRIDSFYYTFKKQWDIENKPFGFEHHSQRIGGLKQRLLQIKLELNDYIEGVTTSIPVLEERVITIANDDYHGLTYNNYYWDYTSFGKI